MILRDDHDADWTASAAITGKYDVRKDTELDGDVDASDVTHANSIAGGYQTLGRGMQSSPAVGNRRGYAGYEYDPTFEGAGRHLSHVRNRVYDAGVGRWTRRDPIGYSDGMSLYAYVQGLAIVAADPWGLFICVGGCQPPMPVSKPSPGGGGGPPLCAGGTCGTPIAPGPGGGGGLGPIICAGGICSTPMTNPEFKPTCFSDGDGGGYVYPPKIYNREKDRSYQTYDYTWNLSHRGYTRIRERVLEGEDGISRMATICYGGPLAKALAVAASAQGLAEGNHALQKAEKLYSASPKGRRDAFRHCYWSCNMASSIGRCEAKQIGNAHEARSAREGDNQSTIRMDKINNKTGRSLARLTRNPATKKDCEVRCRTAIMNKTLIYNN